MGEDTPIYGRVHIDSFSTSLEDMPVKDKRDPFKVFDWMAANRRFSCFEIDDHLAPVVDELSYRGYIKDVGGSYPWSVVKPTERGLAWRRGELGLCPDCDGEGYQSRPISKRSAIADPCATCDNTGFVPTHPTDKGENE